MSRTALLLIGALAGGSAQAYPHLQLSSGTAACQSCHHAPAGGGQLTDFGRDQSEELTTWGGNGGLLHGWIALPSWLSFGGDVRLAGLLNDAGSTEGAELAVFPMQADLSARVGTDFLSVTGVFGLRGTVRGDPAAQTAPPPLPVLSREHYVTFRPRGDAFYLRAGRFFAPYGLRLADHTAYVRRYLDLGLERETYGLSGGHVDDEWEVHATAFAADPWRTAGPVSSGGAAMGELRFGEATLGLSTRAAFGATRRLMGGAFGKLWMEPARLLWMAELDLVHERFASALPSRMQLAAYAGPVWTPITGVWVGAAYEAFAEDLSVAATARHALGGWVSFMPWTHLELMLSSRVQLVGTSDRAYNVLAQLHYFL